MSRASTDKLKSLEDLTVDPFKLLQQLARRSPSYDPYSRELLAVETNLAENSPTETLERLHALAEIHQTCSRFHYLRARAFELLGDSDEMEHAVQQLQSCLRLLRSTGEGSKDSPFSVAFVSDQEDVVRSFGEQKRYQQAANTADKQFDVVTAHSGREFWFDVTEIVAWTNARLSRQT